MIKYLLATAALVVAGVPAAFGLVGNASFTRDVPVRVPQQAQTTTPSSASTGDDGTADRGRGGVEHGDDRGGDLPRALRSETGDDHGGATHHAEPGDDRGDDHGDDHGGTSGRNSSDDSTHSTTSGSSHDSGDDHGGTSGSTTSVDSGTSGSGLSGSDDGGHGGGDSSGSGSSGSGSSGGSDDGSGHH